MKRYEIIEKIKALEWEIEAAERTLARNPEDRLLAEAVEMRKKWNREEIAALTALIN